MRFLCRLINREYTHWKVGTKYADIIKKAMICIHQKLKERGLRSKMILQVHDELNFKCHHEEIEELKNLVVDCMEHVVSLAVPLTVGTGYGKSWYEAH